MDTITDLTRLLKLCPKIKLDHIDIQEIIDTKSFNGVISRHKLGQAPTPVISVEPTEEPAVAEIVVEDDEDICTDPDCEFCDYD